MSSVGTREREREERDGEMEQLPIKCVHTHHQASHSSSLSQDSWQALDERVPARE